MLRRFIRRSILTGALSLGLVAAGVPGRTLLRAEGMARVKLGTVAPKGTSFHRILLAMGEKWRQAPEGGIALTIYTDGTLGSEADMVRKMRVGQIHAALVTTAGLSEIEPSVTAIQNMPMMFRSLEEVDYVRKKLQPMLEKRFHEKGFVVLSWSDAGWVRFFSRDQALRPEDFKKMKIFSLAGDNKQIDLMNALGYQPVPLEYTDILTGLQTGLIDVVPNIPSYALAGQFCRDASHMLEINWAPVFGGTVITKKAWDSLPFSARDALLKAATEAGEQITSRGRAESNESVTAMMKRGLKVHPPTSGIEAEWRKFAEGLYPKNRGTMVPADMFDEVQRLLQEYRASGRKP